MFQLIAEQLGWAPGDLEVITAGVNHMNWLFDIRHRDTGKSCMAEFLSRIESFEYWHRNFPNVPEQRFSLEVPDFFGMYPVGYDEHIVEYMPFFSEPEIQREFGLKSLTDF